MRPLSNLTAVSTGLFGLAFVTLVQPQPPQEPATPIPLNGGPGKGNSPTLQGGVSFKPSPCEERGFWGDLPHPASVWAEEDRKRFADILAGFRSDLLLAPVQIDRCGIDRGNRSLMGAQLSDATAAARGGGLADPYVVQRALGEGMRQIDFEEIRKIAMQTGAKRALLTYAGHDTRGNLLVTAQIVEIKTPLAHNAPRQWSTFDAFGRQRRSGTNVRSGSGIAFERHFSIWSRDFTFPTRTGSSTEPFASKERTSAGKPC
jgi:hypothetical protein